MDRRHPDGRLHRREAATGNLDPTAVAGRFLDWYRSGPADVGIQTSGVLSRAKTAGDVVTSAATYFKDHPNGSAGNGSLMRTAPVALAALGDDDAIVELTMTISALTHGDPLAGEACALWCVGIDRAMREGHFEGVRDGVELLPANRRAFWSERLDEAAAGPPSRFTPNGFVVTALQAALRHLEHARARGRTVPPPPSLSSRSHSHRSRHRHRRRHRRRVTRGRLGASAIPVEWQVLLHGRPGYKARDLVRLGVLAATGGKPDSSGWPAVDDMTEYYEHNFPADPIVKPLTEDPGVVLANVYGAAETKADVTVSLCRMGRTQLETPSWAEIRLLDFDDAADNPNLDFILHDLAQAMVRWRTDGRTVLVHCVQAERRTPAVAAAYLAEKLGISGDEALQRVRAQVPGMRTNVAFTAALNRLWPPGHPTYRLRERRRTSEGG